MKRGEIYYVNLDPTIGSEIKKKRPVIIISNNASNKASTTLTILPITSKVTDVYPFEVELSATDSGLPRHSKIQCHQIRTISKLRINTSCIGSVDKKIFEKIKNALALHLGFN